MNMLIKRERWRKEGKIAQRDRRNKKKREKYKRARVQLLRVAGPIRHKRQRKTKNRYKFHFVLYPPRNSVTSPTRGPLPSAVALLLLRRRIGNGRRTRIILLVADTNPLSCLVELNLF